MEAFPEIPGYRIEKQLSDSEMAKVFLGVREDLDQSVAIKVLNPGLFQDKAFAERFMNEAKDAGKFVHPNIANVLEAGEAGGIYYIVVEYLTESLRDKINSQFDMSSSAGGLEIERGDAGFSMEADQEKPGKPAGKLEGRSLLKVLKQLVQALEYAHKNGVIHKDIRPENICFREDGTPVLVDFFISRVLEPDAREKLKQMGINYGSAHYGGPEQALRKPLDSKGDIYSLGVVLYEILTGKVPYDATEPVTIENQHIMEPLPQLPGQQKVYQALLDQMMAKEKEERTGGGNELVQLIEQVGRLLPPDSGIEQQIPVPPPPPIQEKRPGGQQVSQEDRSGQYDLQVQEDPTRSLTKRDYKKGINDYLEMIPYPKILLPIVGVILVAILIFVVVNLFSPGGEPEEEKQVLTQEEVQMKERQFQHKTRLAEKLLNDGRIQDARKKIEEAEKLTTTPKSKQTIKDLKSKMLEVQDHESYKKAVAAGTISTFEDYLKQFPSGANVKEAKEKLNRLKEEKRVKDAQRQRILDSMTALRSQYKDLSVTEVKDMLKEHGFFEKYYNKSGNFKNNYELRKIKGGKIVIDFATGLVWHQFGSDSYLTFELAQVWLEDLNKQEYAGFSDWRLPTLEEAASLIENEESMQGLYIDSVFAIEQRYIWTGDTYKKKNAWVIDFFSGDASKVDKSTNVFVRPVRTLKLQ